MLQQRISLERLKMIDLHEVEHLLGADLELAVSLDRVLPVFDDPVTIDGIQRLLLVPLE